MEAKTKEIKKDMNIAVIYPKARGDLIFLLDALHTLHDNNHDLGITLVVKDKQAPLAEGLKGKEKELLIKEEKLEHEKVALDKREE